MKGMNSECVWCGPCGTDGESKICWCTVKELMRQIADLEKAVENLKDDLRDDRRDLYKLEDRINGAD